MPPMPKLMAAAINPKPTCSIPLRKAFRPFPGHGFHGQVGSTEHLFRHAPHFRFGKTLGLRLLQVAPAVGHFPDCQGAKDERRTEGPGHPSIKAGS